ncbi:hypothetical protein ACEQ8H_008368 [Pleosporales sp. CAS-2024a]
MAASNFPTRQYPSSEFVESCGTILFDLSQPCNTLVCLGHLVVSSEWVLVKGRRNINESRQDAAIRETYEETGYRCKLLPVRMSTRATAVDDAPDVPDRPREHDNLTEPFMCTMRELGTGKGVKMIWWFIAVLDMLDAEERGPGEQETMQAAFMACEAAVETLTFETDRHVLRRAINILGEQG